MCGIVGFTGVQQAAPILLSGLSKLEYRGCAGNPQIHQTGLLYWKSGVCQTDTGRGAFLQSQW